MPRKTAADATVAKPTKARAVKTPTAAKSTTTSKKTAKSAAAKATATKPAATTAANKKKPAAKSADGASVAKANISKKRQRDADEEDDDEEESGQETKPKTKKTKLATTAPRMTKSKTAASKSAASKSQVASSKASKTTKKKAASKAVPIPRKAAAKRKAGVPVDAAPIPKKAKTTASKKTDEAHDDDAEEESDDGTATTKKAKVPVTEKKIAKKAAPPKKNIDPVMKVKIGAQINLAPTAPLDIFVFGEGSAGELGLGAKVVDKKRPIDVKRPRKNLILSAPDIGVVQVACGGMHSLALTKDNKILSWGVNDQGALGRSTKWDGGLRDVDASDSDDEDEDDTGLNPVESTPAEIDTTGIAPGTKFVQVAACDSASFALTEDGRVYGWGTFRVSLPPAFPIFMNCPNDMHSLAMVFWAFLPLFTFRKLPSCCLSLPKSFPLRLVLTTS